MKIVKFELYPQAPIACNPDDCYFQSQYILPGSMVRGALANLYLQIKGRDQEFRAIFERGANRFPFLFPADEQGNMLRKAPRTTLACKRHGREHPLVSGLADLSAPSSQSECAQCGQDLKPFNGYLRCDPPFEQTYVGHTAINAATRTAQPHAFFQELIISPQPHKSPELAGNCKDANTSQLDQCPHWCGYGQLDESSLSILSDLCQRHPVMIGKCRSRGKGWAHLQLTASPQPAWPQQAPSSDEFSLHCITPLILLDEFLRPSLSPIIVWEGEKFKPEPQRCVLSTCTVRGWSVVHLLPKVEDVAVDMGAVFIFRKTAALQDPDKFAALRQYLHNHGLGERRIEGFGQVLINDAYVVSPKAAMLEKKEATC